MHPKPSISPLPSKPLFANLNPLFKRASSTDPLQSVPDDLPSSVSTNESPVYGFNDSAREQKHNPERSSGLGESEGESEGEKAKSVIHMEVGHDADGGAGIEAGDRWRDGVHRARSGRGRFKLPSFASRRQSDDEDRPSRVSSFSVRDGSERSYTRRNSIWSIASGWSRKSSNSSTSRWSLRKRRSSIPTITPAEMGVVREDAVREQQEEVLGLYPSGSEQSPYPASVGAVAPPPSLVCDGELKPPRGLLCLEGHFRDEKWQSPSNKLKKRQSTLRQHIGDVASGQVVESANNDNAAEEMAISDVRTITDDKI